MTENYKRPTVGGWLAPVLVGPWVSTYASVTLYAFVLGPEGQVTRWALWALGMALGTLFASAYVLALVLVDVLLLAIRSRILPTGRAAWAMSFFAPLVPLAAYATMKPWTLYKYGPWVIAGAVLAPIVVSAFGARMWFGHKTQDSRSK